MTEQGSILDKFPKQRIELPEAYQRIYNRHYVINREGQSTTTSLSQKLESWMHKKVAEDVLHTNEPGSTLEIGAGTLNQLKYEPVQQQYDIVEPFKELFEGSPLLQRIRHVYFDINEVPPNGYDRITTIATFEHIMDLPFVVAKAATLLNTSTGHLRVAIPNEGTIMWKLGTMVTGFEFKKKYGLDYQVLMKYEHVNTAADIEQVLSYFFEKTRCSVFGISKGLAFYRFYDCSLPRMEKVREYFERKAPR
jgi:hypothetical protein